MSLGNLLLSLAATALILAVAYFGGSYWGEDMQEFVSPAFNWQ